MHKNEALIMLANGYYEQGLAFSGTGTVFGEFVFVTAMSGYEEVMTDPSYKGQIIVFTYPLMGNYGITGKDRQADNIHAEAIVIRENSRIISNHRAKTSLADFLKSENKTGVERIDTRALTKQIRTQGAMQGAISTEILNPEELKKQIELAGSISDINLYKKVVGDKVRVFEGTSDNDTTLLAIDFGIKRQIIEDLKRYFNKIYLVPFDDNFDKNLAEINFDGVFISNGPGDPRIVEKVDKYIKEFADNKKPVIGICFGLQLVGRSLGLDIVKLPFGHHGANHPVQYTGSGKVYISSQNHNYAISNESIEQSEEWELVWKHLYDGTVSGIRHKHLPINAVQFHPEASPGPHDVNHLVFSDFYKTVAEAK
jgi:carbamoyl-phosphate synthase small subunit